MSNFSRLLNASAQITFWTLRVRANFGFRLFNVSSVSALQSAKKRVYDLLYSIQWKVTEHFRNRIEKYGVFVQKSLSLKKIFRKRKLAATFSLFVLIYPWSKFWGNRANSLWVLAFYSVRFKWKNWFEKTALKMSTRGVIFTFGQTLKPRHFSANI